MYKEEKDTPFTVWFDLPRDFQLCSSTKVHVLYCEDLSEIKNNISINSSSHIWLYFWSQTQKTTYTVCSKACDIVSEGW